MPASHRRYAEVTPEMLRERAARIGPATAILVDVILRDRPHPEQGFRSCLGILRLARSHGRSGSRPPATGRWQSTRAP
jgi:transposase